MMNRIEDKFTYLLVFVNFRNGIFMLHKKTSPQGLVEFFETLDHVQRLEFAAGKSRNEVEERAIPDFLSLVGDIKRDVVQPVTPRILTLSVLEENSTVEVILRLLNQARVCLKRYRWSNGVIEVRVYERLQMVA